MRAEAWRTVFSSIVLVAFIVQGGVVRPALESGAQAESRASELVSRINATNPKELMPPPKSSWRLPGLKTVVDEFFLRTLMHPETARQVKRARGPR
jgi:hypothetical protein